MAGVGGQQMLLFDLGQTARLWFRFGAEPMECSSSGPADEGLLVQLPQHLPALAPPCLAAGSRRQTGSQTLAHVCCVSAAVQQDRSSHSEPASVGSGGRKHSSPGPESGPDGCVPAAGGGERAEG